MITTIHARPPHVSSAHNVAFGKPVHCPRCYKTIGAAHEAVEVGRLLSAHRCRPVSPDILQPSTAVPFS